MRIDRPPVFLVHGFSAWPQTLASLRRDLAAAGRRAYYVDLPFLCLADIRESSRALARSVRGRLERLGRSCGDLVAMSLGGLIALDYAQTEEGGRRVRRLVAVGTPFEGVPISRKLLRILSFLAPAALQMLPGSCFLRELRARGRPNGVELISVSATGDRLAPPERARFDGAEHIEVAGMWPPFVHQRMLFHRAVNAAIVERLNAA